MDLRDWQETLPAGRIQLMGYLARLWDVGKSILMLIMRLLRESGNIKARAVESRLMTETWALPVQPAT